MTNLHDPYAQMVYDLAKSGHKILPTLNPHKVDAWHHSSCVCGEAGELFDAVKKWIIYNGPLDMKNVIEELGDLEFYLEGLRQALGISRNDTLAANMSKLAKRYPNYNYSDQAAAERMDKK